MKILNLYAGIGGNRKLWGNEYEVTAVENNFNIANIYQNFFPEDKIYVKDAHQYLLDHSEEFDFIWSSPPCPTHSDIRRCGVHAGQYNALYPDMTLYQQIILLRHFALKQTKWVIENVKPYYEPLIKGITLQRHLFWSNFTIKDYNNELEKPIISGKNGIASNSEVFEFKLDDYEIKDKRKILRNLVNPKLGLHILNQSQGIESQKSLF